MRPNFLFTFCFFLFFCPSGNAFEALGQQHAGSADPLVVNVHGFRATVHIPSEAVAQQVKQTAAKTWEVAARLYGAKLPSQRMEISLYRDTAGYEAAEAKLTKGRFKRNLAFAHFETLSAHVALQPYLTDKGLEDVGLPMLTAQLFSHEMAHLVRYHHMPNSFQDHPRWFVDGVATWIDRTVVTELGLSADDSNDPKTGDSVVRAKKLIAQGTYPSVKTILANEVEGLAFYEHYAVNWTFFSMLMNKHPIAMRAYIKDIRRLGGGAEFAQRSGDHLLKMLKVNSAKLDREVKAYVESLSPVWVDTIRSLETAGDQWVQIAFPKSNAVAWQQKKFPSSFQISTDATILRGANHQLNLRLGNPNSFVQISATADFGINIFQYSEDNWEKLHTKKLDSIKVGSTLSYRIRYDRKTKSLKVKVSGEEAYAGEIELVNDCSLGLSAQRGTVVTWENLKVASLRLIAP